MRQSRKRLAIFRITWGHRRFELEPVSGHTRCKFVFKHKWKNVSIVYSLTGFNIFRSRPAETFHLIKTTYRRLYMFYMVSNGCIEDLNRKYVNSCQTTEHNNKRSRVLERVRINHPPSKRSHWILGTFIQPRVTNNGAYGAIHIVSFREKSQVYLRFQCLRKDDKLRLHFSEMCWDLSAF